MFNFRSCSTSFFRRGSTYSASPKKSPASDRKVWNPWSIEEEDQIRPKHRGSGAHTRLPSDGDISAFSPSNHHHRRPPSGNNNNRIRPPGSAPLLSQRKAFLPTQQASSPPPSQYDHHHRQITHHVRIGNGGTNNGSRPSSATCSPSMQERIRAQRSNIAAVEAFSRASRRTQSMGRTEIAAATAAAKRGDSARMSLISQQQTNNKLSSEETYVLP